VRYQQSYATLAESEYVAVQSEAHPTYAKGNSYQQGAEEQAGWDCECMEQMTCNGGADRQGQPFGEMAIGSQAGAQGQQRWSLQKVGRYENRVKSIDV
jgi:hypothetical protein